MYHTTNILLELPPHYTNELLGYYIWHNQYTIRTGTLQRIEETPLLGHNGDKGDWVCDSYKYTI